MIIGGFFLKKTFNPTPVSYTHLFSGIMDIYWKYKSMKSNVKSFYIILTIKIMLMNVLLNMRMFGLLFPESEEMKQNNTVLLPYQDPPVDGTVLLQFKSLIMQIYSMHCIG